MFFYPYLFNGNVCQPQIKQIFPFQPTFSYSNMASSKVFRKIRNFRCSPCWLKLDILHIVFYAAKRACDCGSWRGHRRLWSSSFAAQLSVNCTFFKKFFPFVRFGCVCTEIYFSLFSDRYDMDVAQCVEVNTTPARSNWGELH